MNVKKFLLASLVVFITMQITDQLVHNLILGNLYEQTSHIWRQDMMSMMWLMILVSVFFSLLFVYIFIQGYEGGGVVEGLRYGIIIGLFFQVVGTLNQYVVYPLPFKLVIQWIIFGLIQFSIAGILSALIYKPKPKKP